MIIWKDVSHRSRGAADKSPRIVETVVQGLKVTVHKYVGCGDDWFVSANALGINQEYLGTTDLEVAKAKAIEIVLARLRLLFTTYGDAIRELEEENN